MFISCCFYLIIQENCRHGVRQRRNPWSDGAEYITQCPIRPGKRYTYKFHLTTEEGTIWWHAHSGWARATVHGMIIVYPIHGAHYPFPKPYSEVPIILGEWWKKDVMEIPGNANKTGGEPLLSDAYTINGQPGDLYPCSKQDTFKITVEQGKTYLLRIVSAVMDENLFFSIAKHKLILLGTYGCYTKPFKTDHIMITPGQSMDVLLQANQPPSLYYMAARSYSSTFGAHFDTTTTTAIVQYRQSYDPTPLPFFPRLPPFNATRRSTEFTRQLRSLATEEHPSKEDFPINPPRKFDYTGKKLPENLLVPEFGTRVVVLEYNAGVELILQGTNVLASDNHPIHLHGYSFYVVGWGFGNFDPIKDPLRYNLVDPPEETTVGIPNNGWVALRFRADNPGVWLMHCHLERHQSWGMGMVFIVKDGATPRTKMVRPPSDLPEC
ncbi:unnamed protein product [Ilex paraguariensis]|uniref:laccase n=1 Tax=Ilex paraguariensis TaxID=185542 RepID=A0ABC8SGG3_9AQUA